jgi:hypothetical protein
MKWKAPTAYGDSSSMGPMRKPKRRLNSPSSNSLSDDSNNLALYYLRSQKTLPPLTHQPSSLLPPMQQYLVYPNTTPRSPPPIVNPTSKDTVLRPQEEILLEQKRLIYSPHTRSITTSEPKTRVGKKSVQSKSRESRGEPEAEDEDQEEHRNSKLLSQAAVQQMKQQKEEEQKDYRQYMYYATKYGPLDALLYCCTNRPGKIYAILIDVSIRRIQKWCQERMQALRKFYICFLARQNVVLYIQNALENIVCQLLQQQKALSFWQRLRLRVVHQCFVQWYFMIQQDLKAKQIYQRFIHHEIHGHFITWYDHVQARIEIRQANITRASKRLFQRILLRCLQAWVQSHTKNKRVRGFLKAKLLQCAKNTFDCWKQTIQRQLLHRKAIIKIQAQVRCFVKRKQYKRYLNSALVLSRMIRGFLARKYVKRLREQFEIIACTLKQEKCREKTQALTALQEKRRALFDEENSRIQEENHFVKKFQRQIQEEVLKSLGKVLSNAYRHQLGQKIKYYKAFTTSTDEKKEPKRLSTKEATEKATKELIEEAKYDAAMNAHCRFRQENPPLFSCNRFLPEKDYHGKNLTCLGTFSHHFFMNGHLCFGYNMSNEEEAQAQENRRMLHQLETIEEKEKQQLEVELEVPFEISDIWKRLQ